MSTSYDEFIHALSELESGEFLEELSEELGKEVEKLIRHGFDSATDPYGNVWAPRQLAKGRVTAPHLPLDLTGLMKGNFLVSSSRSGVKVDNTVTSVKGFPYPLAHQFGTRSIDARPMLPNGADGLGRWEDPLRETAQRVFNSKLNEVG